MPSFIKKFTSVFTHVFIFILIFSLCMSLSMVGQTVAFSGDDGTARVHARLNSPERAVAIAEAARKDEAMRRDAQALSPSSPQQGGVKRSAALLVTNSSAPDGPSPRTPIRRPDYSGPRSTASVLMGHAASLFGVPAPVGDLNQDEGLGFHQDGTVRNAGGSASGYGRDGRRAAAYSSYGMDEGYSRGLSEPGYDPITGFNYRIGDPTAGGRISGVNGIGGTSHDMSQFDPARAAMDRGLFYSLGIANSAAESALSGLVDGGRARLNFMIDWNGKINGEGDALYPFYDSQYTTIYIQLGARTMNAEDSKDRWIGNLGLGQRWFPGAENLTDSGDWMLGYNVFYDYDFTRSHQRGGAGAEVQYDWLRLASNYYFPMSCWRDSKDFDGDFVKERAAEGWDLRVRSYLPFYRNVAVTGAYSQWYGDHVGMFGAERLEKDPKIWSYGVEYTPVPLVSGFLTRRVTEQGRTDTEVGLRLTCHFQMPWEDQISHSKVAQLRTVSGSRHEFADRENRIILEYKAKDKDICYIEYLGPDGARGFLFRVCDRLGKYIPGQMVRVTAQGAYLAEAATPVPQTLFARAAHALDELISIKTAWAAHFTKSYLTDSQGFFWVPVDPASPAEFPVSMQARENTQDFILNNGRGAPSGYAFDLSALTVAANGDLGGTITVRNSDNSPAVGVPVTVSYKTAGGSGTATVTEITLAGVTDANGSIAPIGKNVTDLQRKIAVAAKSGNGVYSAATNFNVGAALLPTTPFITGVSLRTSALLSMNWSAAQSYCASHGGRLPTAGMAETVFSGSPFSAAGDFTTGNTLPFLAGYASVCWTRDVDIRNPGGTNRWVVNVSNTGTVNNTGPGIVWDQLRVVCVQ